MDDVQNELNHHFPSVRVKAVGGIHALDKARMNFITILRSLFGVDFETVPI